MPNTPDIQTLGAVNVTSLLTTFPKQITEREYIVLGQLNGVESVTVEFTGLGKHPKTGINPVMVGEGVQGAFALLNLSGPGGTLQVCSNGVFWRDAGGSEDNAVFAPADAEPALDTIMGVDDFTAGQFVPGSAAARTWRVVVTRVSDDACTVTLTNLTATPDQVWECAPGPTGLFVDSMTAFVGNPNALGTKHSDVLSSAIDVFASAVTVTLDETAPVVSGFTIPGTDTDYEITISTFTVTEAGGTVYRAITTTDVAPAVNSPLWSASGVTPATFTIPVAEQTGTGTYTLYGWAKDGAGNISASVSDTVDLTIA